VRLETIPVTFDEKVSILISGQADITIAPLLQTPEREKLVDFITYSMSAQCLFGLATNPRVAQAKSFDDLNRSDELLAPEFIDLAAPAAHRVSVQQFQRKPILIAPLHYAPFHSPLWITNCSKEK
jgi:ABC-type amino acid transport substrate-binding protein